MTPERAWLEHHLQWNSLLCLELTTIQLRLVTSPFKIFHDFSGHSSNCYLSLAFLGGNTNVQKDGCTSFFKKSMFYKCNRTNKKIYFFRLLTFQFVCLISWLIGYWPLGTRLDTWPMGKKYFETILLSVIHQACMWQCEAMPEAIFP